MEITAHRGDWRACPENTLQAFRRAAALGVKWIELDVQLSQDEVVFVFHDDDLRRIDNQDRRRVSQMSWDELREVELRYLNRPDDEGSYRMPTFESVLQWARGRVNFNVELKYQNRHEDGLALLNEVRRVLDRGDAWDCCILSSLNHRVVRSGLQAGLPIGPVIDRLADWSAAFSFVSVRHDLIDADRMAAALDGQQTVHAWTVNEKRRARQLRAWGVHHLITDEPEQMLALVP